MPKIEIDKFEYYTYTLRLEAKASLDMLVLSWNKRKQLQQYEMITQTARNDFMNAIMASLPIPLQQVRANDTIRGSGDLGPYLGWS